MVVILLVAFNYERAVLAEFPDRQVFARHFDALDLDLPSVSVKNLAGGKFRKCGTGRTAVL